MGLTAKEALEKILKGEDVRESVQSMNSVVIEEEADDSDLDGILDLEDEYADWEEEEEDMTDEEFEEIFDDLEFESETETTEENWDQIASVIEKKVRKIKGGKVVTVDVKRKKKKRLSAKQKAGLKKAQKAAQKPGAKRARAKSMKKRKSSGL